MDKAALLKEYAGIIISDDTHYGQVKKAVDDLHELIIASGGLNAYEPYYSSSGTWKEAGLAVSPLIAARCAFDLARTKYFARGVNNALHHLLAAQAHRPLRVLYAGCGPYALLALLNAPFFTTQQVQFTLLDLHGESLTAAKELIAAFGLEHMFEAYVLEDALKYQWPSGVPLDMIITETMQVALNREQQVFITNHLVPQLAPWGVLVPEEITVSAALVHRRDVNEEIDSCHLSELIRLNKKNVAAYRQRIPEVEVQIPQELARDPYDLELLTTIRTWGDLELKGFDSGLTIPFRLNGAEKLAGHREIRFFYQTGTDPRFTWTGQ